MSSLADGAHASHGRQRRRCPTLALCKPARLTQGRPLPPVPWTPGSQSGVAMGCGVPHLGEERGKRDRAIQELVGRGRKTAHECLVLDDPGTRRNPVRVVAIHENGALVEEKKVLESRLRQ